MNGGASSNTAIELSPLYSCPVCGHRLRRLPYSEWTGFLRPGLLPPYGPELGSTSYEVSACCLYEFGSDDDPGFGEGTSFDDYRAEWIADGCPWRFRSAPPGWDPTGQLRRAGLLKR